MNKHFNFNQMKIYNRKKPFYFYINFRNELILNDYDFIVNEFNDSQSSYF